MLSFSRLILVYNFLGQSCSADVRQDDNTRTRPSWWPRDDVVAETATNYFPEFFQSIPVCDELARSWRIGVGPWLDCECFSHELEAMRVLCAQLLCIAIKSEAQRWSGGKDRTVHAKSENATELLSCLGTHSKLNRLSVGAKISGCFAVSSGLYEDIDRQVEQILAIINLTPRAFSSEVCHQVSVWASHLSEAWYVYHIGINDESMARWVALAWPRFRLPPWLAGPLKTSVAINNIITMLYAEQSPRRILFVESGVFFANTSVLVIHGVAGALADIHLVDPWEDEGLIEPLKWQSAFHTSAGSDIMREVKQKIGAIPDVVVCDECLNPATISTCIHICSQVAASQIRVHLHRSTAWEASRRFEAGIVDVAFVDGSHKLDDVVVDLVAWWWRLRPGGILAGHDFTWMHRGVPAAVCIFLGRLVAAAPWQDAPEVFLDVDSVYWMRKPYMPVDAAASMG